MTTSSTFEDIKNHYPHFLFNERMEDEDNSKWATIPGQNTAYILINFKKQTLANVLLMASRNQCYNQSPNSFEIFRIDSFGNRITLKKKDGIIWKKNEKKYFRFKNSTMY